MFKDKFVVDGFSKIKSALLTGMIGRGERLGSYLLKLTCVSG